MKVERKNAGTGFSRLDESPAFPEGSNNEKSPDKVSGVSKF